MQIFSISRAIANQWISICICLKISKSHLKWNILTPISRSQCAHFDCFVILQCFSKHTVCWVLHLRSTDGLQFGWFLHVFLCYRELCHMLKMLQAIITTHNNGSLWIPKPLNALDPHTYSKNHKQFNTRCHFIYQTKQYKCLFSLLTTAAR